MFEEVRLFWRVPGALLTASEKILNFFALKFGQLKNLPYICTHSAADVGGALNHNKNENTKITSRKDLPKPER